MLSTVVSDSLISDASALQVLIYYLTMVHVFAAKNHSQILFASQKLISKHLGVQRYMHCKFEVNRYIISKLYCFCKYNTTGIQ